MPFYDYRCSKCSHQFEEFLSIADRKKPCKKPCPKCSVSGTVEQTITSAPAACDPIRVGTAGKVDNGFKEVISKIKKAHPRNSIRDY
jgi:putative FmdB family regulatory protein